MKDWDIGAWLREEDPDRLQVLWQAADEARIDQVGEDIHLRGLIECSNHCRRLCHYCGLRAANKAVSRYRLDDDEILACAIEAKMLGYGTVVLQAGEDPAFDRERVAGLVQSIKLGTGLAVTLSLGEREPEDYAAWREAGADRYLLRFETSDPELFARIHPPAPGHEVCDRLDHLRTLRRLGFETGSGIMIGIPGQGWDDLERSIRLFTELGLHMVGVGPFIPHPETPLGNTPASAVPADVTTTCKVIALTRLTCPGINIPATTALATIDPDTGRELGLMRGANIMMPNVTPVRFRADYAIYPDKACVSETAQECNGCMANRIERIGRTVGDGPGSAPAYGLTAERTHSHQGSLA